MVPKKDKSLRMCIDFKHINRACPKDHFPLPRIDQIVDSTAGCERLSFLDAYSGYHQIRLYGPDEVKTAFITPFGCFCYVTMPFGLKNAGATFMRMIQKCLLTQIGMWKHTWMTLWSSHEKFPTYWLTLLKPLPISEGMISSLIHQSAHSEFLAESYSVFSFPSEGSTLIQRRSALFSE